MDKTNTVVVGGDVKGDITSCKIENQIIAVKKNHAWSIQQQSTYISYDVCTKKIVNKVTVPEFNVGGVIWWSFLIIVGVVILSIADN